MERQQLATLKNNKIFKNVNVENLNVDELKGSLLTINQGEILFRKEEESNSIFLVVSGEINLLEKDLEGETDTLIFHENDFFGHEEFLTGTVRGATAVALRDSYIFEFSKVEIDSLIEQEPEILNNIYSSVPDIQSEDESEDKSENIEVETEETIERIDELSSTDDDVKEPDDFSTIEEELEKELSAELENMDVNSENKSEIEDISEIIDLPNEETKVTDEPEKEDLPIEEESEKLEDLSNADNEIIEDISEEANLESEIEHTDKQPTTKKEKQDTNGGYMTLEQLERINEAAKLVNSNIKIDDVLKNIVDVAVDLTDADRGTLYLVTKEKNELWSKIAMGSESKEIKLKMGEGIAGWVAEKGETLNIEDAQVDERFNVAFDISSGYKTKSILCFPIKNKNEEVVGVLQLLNSSNEVFRKEDENILNALSTHAALALQNADLVEQLLKSERISSLGKMANFLINDIKKPILVSKRYAEHLKNKELDEDVIKVIDMLLEQLNNIADLVQSTSSYSDSQTILRSSNIGINELLEDYVNRVDSYVRSMNCMIETDFDEDVNVKIDSKEFFQCFNHLIKNACDAMPEGGTININTKKAEDKILLTVKDYGLGISESLHDKIFEPFMSHGKREGTGLGLSVTKKIIEEHGGTISVKSELGEGATFSVTLPISLAV
ncbi:MAG: GAF domain-containing protein [Melioribacteraceae bacterium]|nr:GAF domain-containing protein [Melioribacteraceae bacterium]